MTRYVVLSGNIGAGKTTVARLVAAQMNALLVEEPVALWQQSGMLALLVTNDNSIDFAFQMFALASRVAALKVAVKLYSMKHGAPPDIVVLDRWLPDDKAFAALALTPTAMANYMRFYALIAELNNIPIALTIWLDVPPAVCAARIRSRGRPEEAHITLAYLEAIDARKHEIAIKSENERPAVETAAAIIAFIEDTV